jgi:hypothetical protein
MFESVRKAEDEPEPDEPEPFEADPEPEPVAPEPVPPAPPAPEVEDPPVLEDDEPEVLALLPLPLTACPTAPLSAVTVPANGAVRVVSDRVFRSAVTVAWAWVTDA